MNVNRLRGRFLDWEPPIFTYWVLRVQSTPDNFNLQGKLKKVLVIGSSSYRKLTTNDRK